MPPHGSSSDVPMLNGLLPISTLAGLVVTRWQGTEMAVADAHPDSDVRWADTSIPPGTDDRKLAVMRNTKRAPSSLLLKLILTALLAGTAAAHAADASAADLQSRWQEAGRLMQLGKLDAAIAQMDGILADSPDQPAVLVARAKLHISRQHWSEARNDLSRAIVLYGDRPAAADALVARAQLTSNADPRQSHADTERAFELAPNNPEACFEHAHLTRLDRGADAALPQIGRCIELSPKDSRYRQMRGEIDIDLERFPEALVDLNQAVEFDSRNPFAWSARAGVEIQLGRFEAARSDAQRALSEFPEHGLSRVYLSIADVFLGDVKGASRLMRDLAKTSPKSLSETAVIKRTTPDAILARVALDPGGSARAHLAWGMVCQARGQDKEASEHYADALRIDSTLSEQIRLARESFGSS